MSVQQFNDWAAQNPPLTRTIDYTTAASRAQALALAQELYATHGPDWQVIGAKSAGPQARAVQFILNTLLGGQGEQLELDGHIGRHSAQRLTAAQTQLDLNDGAAGRNFMAAAVNRLDPRAPFQRLEPSPLGTQRLFGTGLRQAIQGREPQRERERSRTEDLIAGNLAQQQTVAALGGDDAERANAYRDIAASVAQAPNLARRTALAEGVVRGLAGGDPAQTRRNVLEYLRSPGDHVPVLVRLKDDIHEWVGLRRDVAAHPAGFSAATLNALAGPGNDGTRDGKTFEMLRAAAIAQTPSGQLSVEDAQFLLSDQPETAGIRLGAERANPGVVDAARRLVAELVKGGEAGKAAALLRQLHGELAQGGPAGSHTTAEQIAQRRFTDDLASSVLTDNGLSDVERLAFFRELATPDRHSNHYPIFITMPPNQYRTLMARIDATPDGASVAALRRQIDAAQKLLAGHRLSNEITR